MRAVIVVGALALGLAGGAAEAQAQTTKPTSQPTSKPTSKPVRKGVVKSAPVTSKGGLTFHPQQGWLQQEPSSNMRAAQYVLPAEDAQQDADLVVYFFGAMGGGGVDANLERWYGQFKQPDGSDSEKAAKKKEFELKESGLKVIRIDLGGTYVAQIRPGAKERHNKPGYRMLAAIVKAPSGLHFVKALGPAKTLAKWEKSCDAFLEAITRE